MKLRSSIIAMIALSSMSFAGGDIGGQTNFEIGDAAAAEADVVEEVQNVEPIDTIETTTTTIEKQPEEGGQQNQVVVNKQPEKTPEKVVEDKPSLFTGKPYVGVAGTVMGIRLDDRVNLFSEEDYQDRQLGLTGVVGYDFMDYLGAELRAALSLSKENKGHDNLKEVGVYLKPQFPVGDLNLYGLLGYSTVNMSDPLRFTGKNSGFSYGGGLDYGVTENISVFTDIVNYLRDEDGSNSTWGANLGVKYNF
jgi:opacity protein-like surface antigen